MTLQRLFDKDIESMLSRANAIHLDSHFVYSSGEHGPHYIDKDKLGGKATITHHLGHELAWRLHEAEFHGFEDNIRTVIGAPMGAIRLSDHVAFWLERLFNMKVESIYAEKRDKNSMFIRPAFHEIVQSGDTLCIEDVINSGKGARQLVEAVEVVDGRPTITGALGNRGGQTAESIGVNLLVPLLQVNFESFTEEEMPDWLRERPVRTDLGHGAEWLQIQSNKSLAVAFFGGEAVVKC
jgi:orotate phosphoribosyltransferase